MKIEGTLRVPGDKSISHRSLMLAALGDGEARISRILESADVRSTASTMIGMFLSRAIFAISRTGKILAVGEAISSMINARVFFVSLLSIAAINT